MHNFAYLLFNIFVFIPVLILSLITDVKPYKNWRGLAAGYLFVSIPFVLWDIWAAGAGHWGFNGLYVYEWRMFGIPYEEVLFFVTVPYAMMYVWGVVNKHVAAKRISDTWANLVLVFIALVSVVLLARYWPNGYTRSAMLATILCCYVVSYLKIAQNMRFWIFQLALVSIFLVANGFLTALPIITYGENSIIGIRILTIPLEDFFFNFAFINLFLVTYEKFKTVTKP